MIALAILILIRPEFPVIRMCLQNLIPCGYGVLIIAVSLYVDTQHRNEESSQSAFYT